MSRVSLPDRRPSVTVKVYHVWANDRTNNLQVTFGFDEVGHVREMFCADFKEGTDMHVLIGDACVVMSLLLQHGYSVREVRHKLAPTPHSILATLLDTALEVESERS